MHLKRALYLGNCVAPSENRQRSWQSLKGASLILADEQSAKSAD